MKISAERYEHAVVLSCNGELTADSLSGFREAVENQIAEKTVRDVVLNFEQVPFVDSAGLAYLLDLQERLNERLGQVKLAAVDENVWKILEITRLSDVFERCDGVTEAVKAM